MGDGRIAQPGARGHHAIAWSLPPAGPVSEVVRETSIDPALAAVHDQWRRVAEGRERREDEDSDLTPLLAAGMGGGQAYDPRRCASAIRTAAATTVMWIGEGNLIISGVFDDKPHKQMASATVAAMLGFMFFALRKIMIRNPHPYLPSSINPLRQWKNAWDQCGRPGSGLPRKVMNWARSLVPKPAPVPVPVPVPTRMAADSIAITRTVQHLTKSLTGRPWIPPGQQLENWQPFGSDNPLASFNHPTFPGIDIPVRVPHPFEIVSPGRGVGLPFPSGATVF